MIVAELPGPAWGFLGVVGAGAVAGAVQFWNGRRTERVEVAKASGSVATSDAATVFAQQQNVFAASEKLRHDMRDQIERCQSEIASLKAENAALTARIHQQAEENEKVLDGWRKRVEVLEEEMDDMAERLRVEERRNGTV